VNSGAQGRATIPCAVQFDYVKAVATRARLVTRHKVAGGDLPLGRGVMLFAGQS
jgi:hypothetical protein